MDDYSRFPEVEIVHSTSSNTVIPKLDAIFARQGIPSELRNDNGPPFNCGEFASFAWIQAQAHYSSVAWRKR